MHGFVASTLWILWKSGNAKVLKDQNPNPIEAVKQVNNVALRTIEARAHPPNHSSDLELLLCSTMDMYVYEANLWCTLEGTKNLNSSILLFCWIRWTANRVAHFIAQAVLLSASAIYRDNPPLTIDLDFSNNFKTLHFTATKVLWCSG